MLQQAKSEGTTIKVRHAKILFCGASRAGKTSFSRLLRNKSYKNLESTPAGHTKQVLIAGKVNVVGSDWVSLDSNSETQALTEKLYLILQKKDSKVVKSPLVSKEQVKPPLDDISGTEPHSDSEVPIKDMQLSNQSTKGSTYSYNANALISKVNESVSQGQNPFPKTDNQLPTISEDTKGSQIDNMQSYTNVFTEKEMANVHFLNLKESISTKTWDLFTLLDTGGQLEFINMLPAINSSTSITFIFFNLSGGRNSLSSPIVAEYDKKDYEYKRCELGYSNQELLKCLLSSVKVTALKKDNFCPDIVKRVTEDKHAKPVVYIIGTCADVLKANMHERYDQEIQEIDKEIQTLVDSLDQDDVLEFKCTISGRCIHPIDNTVPRAPKNEIYHDDHDIKDIQRDTIDIVSNIRESLNEILKKKAQYEIPISWFILELELRKTDKVCISLTEVQLICNKIMPSHRQMTLEQITQVLKFYHQYGMLLYFDEVDSMKDFVITNPQWLFTNLTKIVMCQFACGATKLYGTKIIKRMHNGICDMELLKKLELDLQEIKLISFLDLLVHLKVIAPMDSGYFIPNMLPLYSCNTETISHEREYGSATISIDGQENQKVEPLLIQFAFGTIPRGLFGFLVVEILQKNSPDCSESEIYTLHGENNLKENLLFRCANLITFHVKPCFFISLIDRISYLELQVRTDVVEASYHCKAQMRVTKALEEVCKRFKWSFSDCRYGFLCKNGSKLCSQSPHLALLNPDKPFEARNAECKNNRSTKLNEAHRVWFKVS